MVVAVTVLELYQVLAVLLTLIAMEYHTMTLAETQPVLELKNAWIIATQVLADIIAQEAREVVIPGSPLIGYMIGVQHIVHQGHVIVLGFITLAILTALLAEMSIVMLLIQIVNIVTVQMFGPRIKEIKLLVLEQLVVVVLI
jgi:hypothetical protein